MAFHTVSNLKDAVSGIISGLDIDTVDNLYGAFERAARVLTQKAYIPEGTFEQNIFLYDGVIDYTCDPRIFGTELVDIRPQSAERFSSDYTYKRPNEMFDRTKGYIRNGTMFTFRHIEGNPVMRIKSAYPLPMQLIDNFSSVWTAGTGVSNVTLDTTFFYRSPSSMRFDTSGPVNGAVLTKNLTSRDITSSVQNSDMFLALESDNGFTDVTIDIGSDSSNYVTYYGNTPFVVYVNGQFNVIKLSKTTTTGSPQLTATDFCRITFKSAAQTKVRIGYLWFATPFPVVVETQTSAIFKNGTSPIATSITTDNDQIILNESAYGLYEYECAIAVIQQVGGGASDPTLQYLEKRLNEPKIGLYTAYRGDNPSEELRMVGSYYDNSIRGYY